MTPDQMEEFEESVQRTYNEDEPDEVLLSRQTARIEDLFDFSRFGRAVYNWCHA